MLLLPFTRALPMRVLRASAFALPALLIALFVSASASAQFSAELFSGTDLTNFVVERSHPEIDFDWGEGVVDPAVGSDHLSIRWTGTVVPEFDELYTFYATSDDGFRLFVNGELLVDDWTVHPARETSGQQMLQAGVPVNIVAEYFEAENHAVARLEWSSASLSREVLEAQSVEEVDPPGIDSLFPFAPFFGGVFPELTPGATGLAPVAVSANLGVGMILTITQGDGVLYVGSRDGRVLEILPGSTSETGTSFLDISDRVWTGQDSGLLGFALHPEFGQSESTNRGFVYAYYVHEAADGDRFFRLSRFEKPDGAAEVDASSETILIQQRLGANLHRGGGLLFGEDDFLYLSIGDLATPALSQRIDLRFNSAVLRIDVDSDPSRSHAIPMQPMPEDPETYSQLYMIPNDNPFVGVTFALEEYYALGARNPHRMSIDRVTGNIFIGDVGSNTSTSYEEINLLSAGANFGWPFREADNDIDTRPSTIVGVLTDPVQSYPRVEGACIIGGYVYRGTAIPSLSGRYIFGDCTNNRIWAAADETGVGPRELIATAPSQLITFGQDDTGEVYFGTSASTLYRLESTGFSDDPPGLLSETGVFSNLATLSVDPAFIPYDVRSPFWSEGSLKQRWFAVPNNGSGSGEIGFSAEGEWSFPEGTVFVKHFEAEREGQAPRRIETRVMVRGMDGKYYGVSYRWRADGSDADLLTEGFEEIIEGTLWSYPSRTECGLCHNATSGFALGLRTSQLNGAKVYGGTGVEANQLSTLDHLGLLGPGLAAGELETLPQLRALDDLTAFVQDRARSYLQSNCAQCHHPSGPGRGFFDARYETPFAQQNFVDAELVEEFEIPNARVIVPNDVSRSMLHIRDSIVGTAQMPPLARNTVDEDWLDLLEVWIGTVNAPSSEPFVGEYYDGSNFDTLEFTRDDPEIDFDWDIGTPSASVGDNEFSIRWTGTIVPAFDETYTFITTADDGIRVFVDDVLVVDDFTAHAAREATGDIALTAGVGVSVVVEYFEAGGRASAKLEWLSPSLARQNVVASSGNTPPTAISQSVSVSNASSSLVRLLGIDAEQSNLDPAIVQFPEHGELTGIGPELIYTPEAGYVGPDSFLFKLSDGQLESAPAEIQLSVPEPGLGAMLFAGIAMLAGVGSRSGRRRQGGPYQQVSSS